LLDETETIIKTLTRDLQIEWEYSTEIYRNSKLIRQLATQLNLFEINQAEEISKIDKIFTKGETL